MMEEGGEGFRSRIALTGELHLTVAEGVVARMSRVEVTCEGTWDAPQGAYRLEMEMKLPELRKLAAMNAGIGPLLAGLREQGEGAEAIVTLEATPAHREALAAAARPADALDAEAMLANEPWMTLVFALREYRVVSVGTVTRWSQPL